MKCICIFTTFYFLLTTFSFMAKGMSHKKEAKKPKKPKADKK